MHDPLWNEIAAFLCRHVVIPRGHQLGPGSRLLQDLRLSSTEARELMDRYFAFFRVRAEGFDPARALPRPRRRWPWAKRPAAADADISASMLLSAARQGRWPAPQVLQAEAARSVPAPAPGRQARPQGPHGA
ncbi:MAG: DUF1493 family protein [Betaproteobacteria bacterium]|nr:DUF1493 family protein [Betaproteobacteria bacterium]